MNNVTTACIGIASFALFTGIRIAIENRRREIGIDEAMAILNRYRRPQM